MIASWKQLHVHVLVLYVLLLSASLIISATLIKRQLELLLNSSKARYNYIGEALGR